MGNAIRWVETHLPWLTVLVGVLLIAIGLMVNFIGAMMIHDAADGAAATRAQLQPAVAVVEQCSNQLAIMKRVMIGQMRAPEVLLYVEAPDGSEPLAALDPTTTALADPVTRIYPVIP